MTGDQVDARAAPQQLAARRLDCRAPIKVLARDFNSRNEQQVPILAAGLALVLNTGLDLFLIPRWGVAGAATASTAGYTFAGAVLLIFFVRKSGLAWQDSIIPRWDELLGHLRWARKDLLGGLPRNGARDVHTGAAPPLEEGK